MPICRYSFSFYSLPSSSLHFTLFFYHSKFIRAQWQLSPYFCFNLIAYGIFTFYFYHWYFLFFAVLFNKKGTGNWTFSRIYGFMKCADELHWTHWTNRKFFVFCRYFKYSLIEEMISLFCLVSGEVDSENIYYRRYFHYHWKKQICIFLIPNSYKR